MTVIAYPFMVLAAVGLGLSAVSHVYSLLGLTGPLGDLTWFLHIGIFVVWFPAVLVAQRLTRGVPQKDWWKAALRGCPAWMRYASYGLFGYAILNFVVFFLQSSNSKSEGPMPPGTVRGFSGHWMVFYGMAFAILYSYIQVGGEESIRKCVAGHEVGPLAKFCEQCGQPVMERASFGRG